MVKMSRSVLSRRVSFTFDDFLQFVSRDENEHRQLAIVRSFNKISKSFVPTIAGSKPTLLSRSVMLVQATLNAASACTTCHSERERVNRWRWLHRCFITHSLSLSGRPTHTRSGGGASKARTCAMTTPATEEGEGVWRVEDEDQAERIYK